MNPVAAFLLLSGPSTVSILSETYEIEVMADPDIEIVEAYDVEIVEDLVDVEVPEPIDVEVN